ncbi:G-protein coupled receptor 4 isoform X1 [Lepisosteus oculatus]|uniref:G-protein coupled receptor 4 isoform X1 n=1 Tax=Lepisosteus oculatus TaxID=7918 RepID=UPI003720E66E
MAEDSCNITLAVDSVGLISIYSLVFALALPCNLLSLWGLYRLLRSGNVMPIFIFNLLVSDLLQVLTFPMWIIYLKNGHQWTFQAGACNFVGFLFYINLYASVAFLSLVALDRYLAIVHPLRSRGFRTVKVALVTSVIVWVVTFLFCLSGLYPTVYDEKNQLCLEKYPVAKRYAMFKIVTVILGFLVPCCILGYTSVRIRWELRSSPSVTQEERRKIVGILCIITVIFIVVFGPYHLVGSYKFVYYFITDSNCDMERTLFLCYRLCYGLTSLNSLLDPLLYIFICDNIRQELKKSLPCLRAYKMRKESQVQLNSNVEIASL